MITKQQQNLIEKIKNELAKSYEPSSFFHSVWFQPLSGRFIFEDLYVDYEIIEPLIANKTLVFKAFEKHQGEKMIRYILS